MYDYVIVGGGIVGISIAMHLVQAKPECSLILIEKEAALGQHQTGHNSGVIHAGVYYMPGSFKAKFCREGATATKAFCRENGIAFDECGKLIVATDEKEVGRLNDLADRCCQNGIAIEQMDAAELKRREPNIRAVAGFLVPATAVTDYIAVCRAMQAKVEKIGGEIRFKTKVLDIREGGAQVDVITDSSTFTARHVICCTGMMADRLARRCGIVTNFRIIPFRGEYYRLRASRNNIVKHLIYPVPDPELPFLGVHLTRMIGGYVTVGPNAVLGLAREGYPRFSFNLRDAFETLTFPGFMIMATKNLVSGVEELWNSLSRRRYLSICRRYCPELVLDDLEPYPAGIRAQAIMRDGTMVHDFLIRRTARTLHVCNAPSPAATSAIPIGKHVTELVLANAWHH